jgi:uncharacterized protein YpiB (UPF0302 family)
MEVLTLEKQYIGQPQLMSLMAEMILDKAIRDYEIDRLYKEIDQSLMERDKERFMRLTDELNTILSET